MSRLARIRLGLLVLGLAVGLHAGRASAQDPEPELDPLARYEWIGPLTPVEVKLGGLLRESRRADDARRAAILESLVAVGVPGVEGLLEILVQERVPRSSAEDAAQCLSVPQRELVLSAIARLPAADVREQLSARNANASAPPSNIATMRILGAIGDENDLRRLMTLPTRDDMGLLDGPSRSVLRQTLASILRRVPKAYDRLETFHAKLDDDAAQEVLKSMADVGDGRALSVFFECARSQPGTTRTAIALVPLLSPSHDVQVALDFAAWLRGQIDMARPEWTRAIFNALGALDEGAAIPDLLDALDTQERSLREASLAALRRISGLSLGSDRSSWDSWYVSESSWYETSRLAPDGGTSEDPDQNLITILRTYSEHRLFRSMLTLDLVPLLDNQEPAIRALVCETLEHLGSQRAVRELIPLLDDPAESVATAARHALETLVGSVPEGAAAARELILHER
jgi:HEAT repeat protein